MGIAEAKVMMGAGLALGMSIGAILDPQWRSLLMVAALGLAGVNALLWVVARRS